MPDMEKVISWVEGLAENDWRLFHSESEVQNIAKAVLALLKEQEAVVRCKDCKYGYMTKNGAGEDAVECSNHYVSLDSICRQPDWFCADGERK